MTKLGLLAASGAQMGGGGMGRGWHSPGLGLGGSGPALDGGDVLVFFREPGWVGLSGKARRGAHRLGTQDGKSGLGCGYIWAMWSLRGPWAVKRS